MQMYPLYWAPSKEGTFMSVIAMNSRKNMSRCTRIRKKLWISEDVKMDVPCWRCIDSGLTEGFWGQILLNCMPLRPTSVFKNISPSVLRKKHLPPLQTAGICKYSSP